jgi:hypothetical protein
MATGVRQGSKGAAMAESTHLASGLPSVVPVADIPPSVEGRGLELRPFVAHAVLRDAVPSTVGMAWLNVGEESASERRRQAHRSLLIVLRGKADLCGALCCSIEQGDVVTLPADHEYGFTNVEAGGLSALLVALPKTQSTVDAVSSLAQLLERNERRVRASLEGPYFQLLRSGVLESSKSRARFRDAARVFSDAFQTILFTRQATCRDESFRSLFLEHFREELGHNELLTTTGARRAPSDPVLSATANWFCHQMLVLDNIEKSVLVHLVLETAGFHFHTLAKPVLANDVSAEYFHVHSAADDGHKDVVMSLLENQTPATYGKLHKILEDGWDMFDTMTRRIVHLVELGQASS